MAHTASELTRLEHFLQETASSAPIPIPLFCHNQVALHIAFDQIFHKRTKHIEVDCHFIRDKILNGEISTPFVKFGDQLVDMFTKSFVKSS
jgi:hypothetical protein